MGHPYSRNSDHIRSGHVPAPSNEAINEHIQKLLSPLIYSQQAYYRSLGLRDRILTLPLMVAAIVTLAIVTLAIVTLAIVTLLWRQVPSVHELT